VRICDYQSVRWCEENLLLILAKKDEMREPASSKYMQPT